MGSNYLDIEAVSTGAEALVRQDLKFRTGNFVWRVKFSTPLNPETVNNRFMNVTSLNHTPLKTSIKYDTITNIIEIEPLEPYAQNESYLLNISKNVKSKGGQTLKNDIQIQFKI